MAAPLNQESVQKEDGIKDIGHAYLLEKQNPIHVIHAERELIQGIVCLQDMKGLQGGSLALALRALLDFGTSGSYAHSNHCNLEPLATEPPVAPRQVIHTGRTRGAANPPLPKPVCLPTTAGGKMVCVSLLPSSSQMSASHWGV